MNLTTLEVDISFPTKNYRRNRFLSKEVLTEIIHKNKIKNKIDIY